MKTSLLSSAAGLGAVLLASALLSTSAFAGPGPQFPQQPASAVKARADATKQVAAPAKSAAAPAMACTACKTSRVQEFASGNGKVAPHYTTSGSRHECASCAGEVAAIRGKTTNTMKENCPICAKAKAAGASCCTAAS